MVYAYFGKKPKSMKRFLNIFFVSLGVIFFIIILTLAYLWVADPFEIKPLIERYQTPSVSVSSEAESVPARGGESAVVTDVTDRNPNLTPAQEDALNLVGIDPGVLPEEITPKQMSCFTEVLGEARVNEIKAGAAPTPVELFKARECL